MKTLVFDMDGTIANFYGVEGWLEDLHNENPRPYIMAEPLWDMALLGSLLCCLKSVGYRIVVTSWLSKDSTKDFDEVVRTAKRDWLARYNFPFDEIHLVKYGTTKANCTRKHGGNQILFDDNANIRKGWNLGETVDPTTENIIDFLADLLLTEQVSYAIIGIESERGDTMAKVLVDFGKCYEEQTKQVKEKFCRHDFYEIKSILNFKKRFQKSVDK